MDTLRTYIFELSLNLTNACIVNTHYRVTSRSKHNPNKATRLTHPPAAYSHPNAHRATSIQEIPSERQKNQTNLTVYIYL